MSAVLAPASLMAVEACEVVSTDADADVDADADGRAGGMSGHGALRWVLDPDDDLACVQALSAADNLDAGRVVCHTSPGASWPVLVRDLFGRLGKDRDALAREGRVRDGAALLELWLIAERVRHVVVLRAHTLGPDLLEALGGLATSSGITVWLVWHLRAAPPPVKAIVGPAIGWIEATSALHGRAAAGSAAGTDANQDTFAQLYGRARAEARREARAWAIEPPPTDPRHHQPGCPLASVLQRLTIDAVHRDDLLVRLHAAQSGFRDEGLRLDLPAVNDPDLVAELGPRLGPPTIVQLRRIVSPTTAAALLLAVATDADSGGLARTTPYWTAADGGRVRQLGGTFRIPPRARAPLRAAMLDAHRRGAPIVLSGPGGQLLGHRRMANLVRSAEARTGIATRPASQQAGSGLGPARPFAPAFTTTASVTPTD